MSDSQMSEHRSKDRVPTDAFLREPSPSRPVSPFHVGMREVDSSASTSGQGAKLSEPNPVLLNASKIQEHITTAMNRNMGQVIEKYCGEEEDIEDWLVDYEDVAKARGWTEQLKKDQLPTHLGRSAHDWYLVRSQTTSDIIDERDPGVRNPYHVDWNDLTWEEVKREMCSEFLSADRSFLLSFKLREPQVPDEDVQAFYLRKVKIATRLKMNPKATARAIRTSLLPDYQRALAGHDIDTPRELFKKLRDVDLTIRSLNSRNAETDKLREEIRKLKQQLKEPEHTNVLPRMEGRSSIRCNRCNREGHVARNCRVPQYSLNPSYNRDYNNQMDYNFDNMGPPRLNMYRNNNTLRQGYNNYNNSNYQGVNYRNQAPFNQFRNNQGFNNQGYNYQGYNNNRQSQNNNQNPNNSYGYNQSRQQQSFTPRMNQPQFNRLPAISLPNQNQTNVIYHEEEEYQTINRVDLGIPIPEFKLQIKLNGKDVEGMLDTGAALTCIDYEYFKTLFGTDAELSTDEKLKVFSAGNKQLNLAGLAELTFEYRDKKDAIRSLDVVVAVIRDLGSQLIIGRDFIARVNLAFDIGNSTVRCTDHDESVAKNNINHVYSCEDNVIPPRSTLIMAVRVEFDRKMEGVITSNNSTNVFPPNSVVQLQEEILLPVTNFSSQRQKLGAGEIIGLFEPSKEENTLNENDITNPYVFMEETTKCPLGQGEVNIGKTLSDEEKSSLIQLLEIYQDLFSFDGKLGECAVLEHDIDTGDSKPVHTAPYRQSHMVREFVAKQVTEWLNDGVIRPSKSPWSSPVVVVPKKDKGLRMCIDLRGVNKLTKRDVYPLPNIEDTLSSLNGAMYFSSLHLNQGYMQIRMEETSIQKTAFVTQDGLYEFTRMPFGLTNAPATFQRCMDIVLSGLKWNQCLVYLDDVIIFGHNLEDHNKHLANVLQRIREANLTIKPSKCAFAVRELKFLGHIVNGHGIRMDPDKINDMKNQAKPTNVTEVRSFIGSATYYRKFIEGFSNIAEPLTRLTQKYKTFEWGVEQDKAFEELKTRLISQPVLCHFDHKIPVELRTDASGYGLGAILLHVYPDKTKRVISYASRLLVGSEKNYAITAKECLAIVWAIKKFKMYLFGIHFTVVTDHLALTWLQNKKDLPESLIKWSLMLQPFDFTVFYKSGALHKDADYLSRNMKEVINVINPAHRGTFRPNTDNPNDEDEVDNIPSPPSLTLDDVRMAQTSDQFCIKILEDINNQPNFTVIDGLLFERNGLTFTERLVIPISLLNKTIYSLHDDPLCGHCGPKKTLWKFNLRYYIKHATKLLKQYVKSCHLCQTRKIPWTRKYGKLHPLQSAIRPFQRIGIDTLGPFRQSRHGMMKIVVITDYTTKWAIARAIPKENSEEIAKILIEEIFLKFGSPEVILSDRGNTFRTSLIQEVYKTFQSRHVTTTAYHPQTNGLTERFNRTLSAMLSMYVSENHRNWDEYLPYVVFAYNTTIQDSTCYSPFYLLYGIQARLVVDIVDPNPNITNVERLEKLYEARELAIKANELAQRQQKNQYDKKQYLQEFEIGSLVLVHRIRGYIGQTTKLRHPYEGPFKIIRKNSDLVYTLENLNPKLRRAKHELVHVSRLKPYCSRPEESVYNSDSENDNEATTEQLSVNNIQMRKIGWINRSISYLLLLSIIMTTVESSLVVWRPTKMKIVTGIQDVIYLVHYEAPCEGNITIFDFPGSQRRASVSEKFTSWCNKFTHEIINRGLLSFCDDGATTNPYYPVGEIPSKMRRALQRRKREPVTTTGIFIGMAVYVALAEGYKLIRNFFTQDNAEAVAAQNLQNIKQLVTETTELNKRVDLAFKLINNTLQVSAEILSRVKDLEMSSSVENQAIVSMIVSRFTLIEQKFRDIAQSWRSATVHRELFNLFELRDPCLESTCPMENYIPINCKFNAIKQDIQFTFRRQMVREDVEVLEADPFEKTSPYPAKNNSQYPYSPMSPEGLENHLSYNWLFELCKFKYIGPHLLAITSKGCVKRVIPEKPTKYDVPILVEPCLDKYDKDESWWDTNPTECKMLKRREYDWRAIQMKIDNDNLRIYCPGQRYSINGGENKTCPYDEVLSLSTRINLTIYPQSWRIDEYEILKYSYNSLIRKSTSRFNLPEVITLIEPEFPKLTETQNSVNQLIDNTTLAKVTSDARLKDVIWKFQELQRYWSQSSGIFTIIGYFVVSIPIFVIIIFILKMILIKTKHVVESEQLELNTRSANSINTLATNISGTTSRTRSSIPQTNGYLSNFDQDQNPVLIGFINDRNY